MSLSSVSSSDSQQPASKKMRDLLVRARKSCEDLLQACRSLNESAVYSIANYPVVLTFDEISFFEGLTPALKHLQVASDEIPVLTVYVLGPGWWQETLGGVLGSGPRDTSANEGFFAEDAGTMAAIFLSRDFSSFSLFLPERRAAFYAASSLEEMPAFEKAAPFRTIFYWAFRSRGRQAVHAACVGTQEGGVLIAGRGGSGKSSTALTCLARGMLFLGDDYVMVDADQTPPMAFSLFASAKLNPGDVGRYPDFGILFDDFGKTRLTDEKIVVCLAEAFAPRIIALTPLRAILIPEITGLEKTEITAIDKAAALRELAPTALLQFPGAGQQDFQRMAGLVRKLPCRRLRLGTQADSLVETLRSFCHHAIE